MKRLLFTLHRWLGIGLGLVMLLWFASGLAMLYAGPSMLPAIAITTGSPGTARRVKPGAPRRGW
jgi:hypothetical protein